jgi:hypothetical protein
MTTNKATPGPWHIAEYGIDNPSYTVIMGGKAIAKICSPRANGDGSNIPKQDEAQANAAFIVKAANNHEQLVAALEDLLTKVEYHSSFFATPTPVPMDCVQVANAKKALAKCGKG